MTEDQSVLLNQIIEVVKLVVQSAREEERERCAKIAENWNYPPIETASGIAAAIRKQE